MMEKYDEKNKGLIMINQDKKQNINYISVLSVISAIAVVILHTNEFWIFSRENYWFTANLIECLFYFAVPIFFMISGITLIDYRDRYDTKEFLKRRIKKTFIPFICWSIIGMLYYTFLKNGFSIFEMTRTHFINTIMETKCIGIYWFFIQLFCVYLCIPLFGAIEKKLRKEVFVYLLIVCAIFNCILPFFNEIFKQNLALPITVQVGSGYLLYIIIGYLLHTSKIDKVTEIIIYLLGIMGLLLHIFGTYNLSMQADKIIGTYKGYNNVPCILYSSAIFLLIKKLCSKIKNMSFFAIINKIKKYTFAIYVIHWYLIDIITVIFKLKTISIFYRLGMPIIIIPLCIFVAYILRKIPFIKYIVPE